MLTDFWILRARTLDLAQLYNMQPDSGGIYYFFHGVNLRAIVAVCCGVAPCIPGFVMLNFIEGSSQTGLWSFVYNSSWFVAAAIAGLVHVSTTILWPPPLLGTYNKEDTVSLVPH